ncbi:unnamed protein product [Soboliphyme baturini]|uniref:Uncharacterized protein n=1 Tax=Soboliphyme baturini TaxID=241478 RepID=A0A183IJ22_9BILA|nr:unnamed protein product [Soboliphyme baturini]
MRYNEACDERNSWIQQFERFSAEQQQILQQKNERIKQLEEENRELLDRACRTESHFTQLIAETHAKCKAVVEQARSSEETAQRQKNDCVVKYAQREKDILVLEASQEKHLQQIVQLKKERDAVTSQLRAVKNEKQQLTQCLSRKKSRTDVENLEKQLKRLREDGEVLEKINVREIKELPESKLPDTAEMKNHNIKSTQERLQQAETKISQLENENSSFRMQSNSLRQSIEHLNLDLNESSKRNVELQKRVNELMQLLEERDVSEQETEACRSRAEHLLALNQKIAEANSQLNAEKYSLTSQLILQLNQLQVKAEQLGQNCLLMEAKVSKKDEELKKLKAETVVHTEDLRAEIEKKAVKEIQFLKNDVNDDAVEVHSVLQAEGAGFEGLDVSFLY